MNRRTKELILRIYDDMGADTLDKYWAQIEYTAYWCTHLLIPQSGIKGVIPEGIDDVVLVKESYFELHQVKCRDESQPPWTTAEVIPILCDQYLRRTAFNQPCKFHFVSDHVADTKTQLRPGTSYGQLFRLKSLLEIEHDGYTLTPEESAEFEELEREILPRIAELMNQGGETVDISTARELLHNTWIETKSVYIRNRPIHDELSLALLEALPGQPTCNIAQLDELYTRLLVCIVKKIRIGKSLDERTIVGDEVLACRVEAVAPESNIPELNTLSGNSIAEKKALFGGFDVTEFPTFALQMKRAQNKRRRFETQGFYENVEDLTLALITLQALTRRIFSQSYLDLKIGPDILIEIQSQLPSCINSYFPNTPGADIPFCNGLLWIATNDCILWWHRVRLEVSP